MLWVLGLAAAIEVVTLGCRYGLKTTAAEATPWLAKYTLGFRIHHGYIGLLLLFLNLWLPNVWLLRVGGALALSDLIHHIIIWDFDFRYGKRG